MKDGVSDSCSPIRIAVVAHALRAAGGLSVGQNILAALGRVAPEHHYFVSIPSGLRYEQVCREIPNCETLIFQDSGSLFRRWRFDRFELPKKINAFLPDAVICLGNTGLLGVAAPQAILCQDAHLFYPMKYYLKETVLRKLIIYYQKQRLKNDLRKAQLLLCQTTAAEKRIRQVFHYKQNVVICPNALSESVLENKENTEVPAPLRPYLDKIKLFCLTRYYPHKNLETVVEVFRRFGQELQNVMAVMTISAEQHRGAAKLLRLIDKYGLHDRILNVGPLHQGELTGYFRNCQALLMPTFLESFSGTYLEAMHFGLPILTSDLDFAHEVCGDAALYFDPWNATSIRDAILRIKNEPELAHDLCEEGNVRLVGRQKSWDEIARNVLQELLKLAKRDAAGSAVE